MRMNVHICYVSLICYLLICFDKYVWRYIIFVDNISGYTNTTICMYVAEDMKTRLASEELRSELFNTGANHRSIIRYINQ